MEKTNFGIVLPLEVGWSDIGSWESMWSISNKDDQGNVSLGKIICKDVKNSYFRSEGRLVVGIGVEDLIVIETQDAVFISKLHIIFNDYTTVVKFKCILIRCSININNYTFFKAA